MSDERPAARFVLPAYGYLWHIKLVAADAALCGYKPSGRRGRWSKIDRARPYFPRICPKCAKKANIAPDISPDDATVRYGEI